MKVMKKLLGIVVLGLLWCNIGNTEEKCIKLIDYDTLKFSSNDQFDQYSWKAEFENLCDRDLYLTVDFFFYSKDDFLLQKDWKDDVPISAKTKKVITNNVLLIRDVADKFGKMGVKYRYQ